MKKKLEKITNLTINELLNNEIILPSLYLEKFSYHAKEIEVNLDDENFEKELNKIIVEDFKTIERYMSMIISNVLELKEDAKEARTALLNKDIDTLGEVYKKMINLEKELKTLNNELFIDDTTKTFNRKWIYNKFLDENASFKKDGICLLIDVIDYTYIQDEYGELLAKNLLLFVTNFISQKLKDEGYEFQIARYFNDKFFVFITNEDKKDVKNYILNLEQMLLNTTLKSNSGLYIKANYKFVLNEYKQNQDSKLVFEKLVNYEKEE